MCDYKFKRVQFPIQNRMIPDLWELKGIDRIVKVPKYIKVVSIIFFE